MLDPDIRRVLDGASSAPAEDPLNPVRARGHLADWIEGDAAWEIIDKIVAKYIDIPYPRENERVVVLVSVDQQTVGM